MVDLTPRDSAILRALARWHVAPLRALLTFFPTPEAAYVRLGILVRSGLIRKVTYRSELFVTLTAAGARAIAARLPRAPMAALARRLEMIRVDSVMAAHGYSPAPRPDGAPLRLWYYTDGRVTVAATACQADNVEARADRLAARLGPSFLAGRVSALLVFTPRPVRLNITGPPWTRRVMISQMPSEIQWTGLSWISLRASRNGY
jgi:hypothetical protein